MELINNRYRIIGNITQNQMFSSYVVVDLLRENKIMHLNILNQEYVPNSLIQFYSDEFLNLTSIRTSRILSLYSFGIINSFDGKSLENSQYYFVREYCEKISSIKDCISDMSYEEILDAFIQVCQAVNYLHLRGFLYNELNDSNIYALKDKNGINIMLKDLATIEMEKHMHWIGRGMNLKYKAPEILNGNTPNIRSDIYSLGILLIYMLNRDFEQNINIEQKINEYETSNLNSIMEIVKKMIMKNPDERYEYVYDVVYDINSKLGKNYRPHIKSEMDSMVLKTKLIGREKEINKIIDAYNKMEKERIFNGFHFIYGERGIGKTRFLNEIKHILTLKGTYTYTTLDDYSSTSNKDDVIASIVKQMIPRADAETLERYKEYLSFIVPEIDSEAKSLPISRFSNERERLYIFSRIAGFIEECVKSKPAVFIIDDINNIDSFSLEFFKYISKEKIKKPVMVVASYYIDEKSTKNTFREFIDELRKSIEFNELNLGSLTIEQTGLMIRNILSLSYTPLNLSAKIYTETYGNPLFIEEVIKNFYTKGIIYLDDYYGRWFINSDDYSEITIPSSVYQAVLNQMESLDSFSIDILKIISIFNLPVSSTAISEILQRTQDEIEEKLDYMIKSGLLEKKVEDWGYVYDIRNKGTKEFIYNGLEEEEKKKKHRMALEFLEKQYSAEGRENKEELIYHLEKAGENEKVIEYYLENADRMESIYITSEALKNLEKALSMFNDYSKDDRKLHILMRMGNIYKDDGQYESAFEYYNKILELVGSPYSNEKCADAIINIMDIYRVKNQPEKCMEYYDILKKIFNDFDYEKGYLNAQMIISNIYYQNQDYEKIWKICNEGLKLSHNKYPDMEGKFCNQIAILNLDEQKVEEALKGFQKSVKLFEKSNDVKGLAFALNNIGVIYGDYLQDTGKSIDYFTKMSEITKRHNFIRGSISAESNLAECYLDIGDNYRALEHYKNSLELSKKLNYETSIFLSYIYLCSTYTKIFQYKEAYEYFKLAKKELENYPVQQKWYIIDFNRVAANLHYTFGEYKIAEEYIKKALEIIENEDFRPKWDCEIIANYIDMMKCSEKSDIEKIIKKIREISRRYKIYNERINTIHNLIFISKIAANENLTMELISEADELYESFSTNCITARRKYIQGIFEKEEKEKLKYFEEALELAKKEKLNELEWRIYNSIGGYWFNKKQYFEATRYYFEACEGIKRITIQIPEEYQISYIKNHGRLNPFKRLMEIKSIYNDEPIENKYIGIDNIDGLKDLFNYKKFWDILDNKHFIKSAEKSYNQLLPKGMNSISDIIKNLYNNREKNLDVVVKLMSKMMLATRGFIVGLDEQNSVMIASLNENQELPRIEFIIEKVNSSRRPILIKESGEGRFEGDSNLLLPGVKAAACIPIFKPDSYNSSYDNKKEADKLFKNQILGYVYLDSDRLLNNFNKKNFKSCCELSAFIGILMENYKLKITSSIDKLTGAYTRKYLMDSLEEEFQRCGSYKKNFSIIMFDIDKFKNVNDRFGHQKGDYVLKEICRIVSQNIPPEYKLCRYGGEEFIIILPDTDYYKAGIHAERIRRMVDEAKILGEKYPITISLGVAAYPVHAQIEHELIEKVDQALYVAKESGRNRSQIWNPEISNKTKRKDRLAGIVTGNTLQDYRNVLAMIELVELVKEDTTVTEKIYKLLGRVIEITEVQYGMLFIINDDRIVEKYGRKKFHEGWIDVKRYNEKILKNVIKERQGIYRVDWDDIIEYDSLTGSPDWQSIIVVPIIKSGKIKGVLYLTVSTKIKEFDFNHFNFVKTLGDIIAAVL